MHGELRDISGKLLNIFLSFVLAVSLCPLPAAWADEPAQPQTEESAAPDLEPNQVLVRFDANTPDGARAEGETEDFVYSSDGTEQPLPENGYTVDGYSFAGWSTTADGEDIGDDPSTESDEGFKSLRIPDRQPMVNLGYTATAPDGGSLACDLNYAVRDSVLQLYAQWEPQPSGESGDDVEAASEDPGQNSGGTADSASQMAVIPEVPDSPLLGTDELARSTKSFMKTQSTRSGEGRDPPAYPKAQSAPSDSLNQAGVNALR